MLMQISGEMYTEVFVSATALEFLTNKKLGNLIFLWKAQQSFLWLETRNYDELSINNLQLSS